MSKRIYVGNLPFSANNDEVRSMFEMYGEVTGVHLVTDRDTGRPRGFGFVEMSEDGAEEAIESLNLKRRHGRVLNVNEARPRTERHGGGGRRHGW